jgi:hypothetical protein
MVVAITNSRGFVWFGHFLLLLELAEVLNLGFAEFCKLVVYLRHCFAPLSNQVTVQRSYPQGFYSLCYDLLITYHRCLGFELEEPSIEIRQWFSLFLYAGKEVFFSIEHCLKFLKVDENLVFQVLPRINTSRRESGIPICSHVFRGDD